MIENALIDGLGMSEVGTLVLDMTNVSHIDVTTTDWICNLSKNLDMLVHKRSGTFYKPVIVRVACVRGSPRTLLRRAEYMGDELGRFFATVNAATGNTT
eukprot:TRINITY_DN9497_c0_g1_i1.p1 TRINITY_DN9497_c0_g1~~TRINITY_DN9497_c0_g1_i1.p1  ORF type:complete len:111 (+),score=23.42 TRINITY_DN9497_c0_g1_i1:38-334(+)